MPSFDPKEYLRKNQKKDEFDPSEYLKKNLDPLNVSDEPIRSPKVVYEPEGRPVQAALYGAGEGITLDNLDEIIARGKSVFTPETYDKLIAEQEAYRRQLEEENPGVYSVSKFGSYAIPGLAATKLLKPATALGRLGIEGGLGAVQGMGQAESLEDVPASMLAGGAFSAGGSAALERAIPLAKKAGGKLSDLFGNVFTNTPPEVSQALRKDPKYLDDVMEIPEIADEAIRRLGQTKSRVGSLSESALATLRPEPLQNKASIIARLEELPEKYGTTGTEDFPESKAILKEIELARNSILKSTKESDIRNILRRLSTKADFGTPSGDSINALRKEMRGIVSEGIKEVNPQYREAMVPLAEQTDLSSRATKILRPEMKDGELVPTDRTAATLQTLMNDLGKDRKIRTRQQLEQLYPGLEEQLRKRQIMNRSQGGVQSGSRNAVTMGLGGGSIAEGINYSTGLTVPPGLIAGASIFAGAAIDKYGRTVGSAIAKAQGRAGRFLSKFGPMLEKSTNRELTHAILMETNPEYQQAFKEMQEGFNDPAQIANLVGSAVLGSDLTRFTGSVGAGIGSAMEGGSFQEGMESRYKELNKNPSNAEGIASLLGAALPTGRAGGIASRVIRGVQSLDELMSETGRQKNAPNLMKMNNYRGEHQSPGRGSGKPLHDLSGVYPDDFYSSNGPRYYGHGENPEMDRKSWSIISALRGNPEKSVTIYRAVPKVENIQDKIRAHENALMHKLATGRMPRGFENKSYDEVADELDRLRNKPQKGSSTSYSINPGDWVTVNRDYAKQHGESALNGKYKIIKKTVKARDLFSDGNSIHEQGYDPK